MYSAVFSVVQNFYVVVELFTFKVFIGDENCCVVRAHGGNRVHTLPGSATASLVLWP